jgi:ADP-heptose:LPS heptosyltransferase
VRVLIVKRDKLGDLLLTRPVLTRLATALPHAEIHLLANDYNAWVARGHPALARTWVCPRVRIGSRVRIAAAAQQIMLGVHLRGQRFDWAIAMGGDESHRAIRRACAAGATRVAGYARNAADYGARLTDPLPPPAEGHETARMLALLGPMGVRDTGPLEAPTLTLPPEAATFARQWLAARALEPNGYVVIGLGARRAKKQPTADQVVAWSTRIRATHGLATVLMWTPGSGASPGYPGDDALAQSVIDRSVAHIVPFRGPIHEALGLIFNARVSVMPDSGLMHFAAASAGGVLGLFADPLDSAPASRWAPLGPRARHIEAPKAVAELPDDAVFRVLDPLLVKHDAAAAAPSGDQVLAR